MSQHCRANPCCGDRPCSGIPLPQHASGLPSHNKKMVVTVETELNGPYGWLNGHRALSEDSWTLENDAQENNEGYFAIPLYALTDPFKEIGNNKPREIYASCYSPKLLEEIRNARNWVLHWMADFDGGLKPTRGSLTELLSRLDAALKSEGRK